MDLGDTCSACGLTCKKEHRTVDSDGNVTGYADPCVGILPGVKFACCGHGDQRYEGAYIFFENGVIIRIAKVERIERQTYSQYHAFNEETTQEKKP